MKRSVTTLLMLLFVLGVTSGSTPLLARQAPTTAATSQEPPPAGVGAEPVFARIALTVGRSHVLLTDFDVTRMAVTNPAIADALVVARREVVIDGKGAGTVSLILWGTNRRVQYDVVVRAGVPALQEQLQTIFPGEDIRVASTDEVIVLSGNVSTSEIALRAAEVAQASSSKQKVVNMLQKPGGPDTQQVMLEVHFAEVERNAMLELGTTLLANRANFAARATTEQFPSPRFQPDVIEFPSYLNLFLFLKRDGLGAVIKALQQRGVFQSLAEPNLVAYNGQEASFLAGGEFPIPLVQGNSGQVTVQFKEFGVRLTFTPTIVGDVIRLKVRPEVSTLDFSNGLLLEGFRIPALKTRRAETDVELRDGQSFAIAGLLDNQSGEDKAAIPFLSGLPIIGPLFKSKAETTRRNELLVLITPRLVRPLNPEDVPGLPVDIDRFMVPIGKEKGAAPATAPATTP